MSQLTDLTYKYGLELQSCGCCDSIWLQEPKDGLKPGMVYDGYIEKQGIKENGKWDFDKGPIIGIHSMKLKKVKPDGKV